MDALPSSVFTRRRIPLMSTFPPQNVDMPLIKCSITPIRQRHTSLLTSVPGTPTLISIFSLRTERTRSQSDGALAGLKRAGTGGHLIYLGADK